MTTPKQDRWYHHVPAVSGTVPCEGDHHRVSWRWGKFKIEDHDLGSERAMLALGGEPCACLRALQLWADQFGMHPDQFTELRSLLGENAALLPKEFELPRTVAMTLNLERAWRRSRYFDKQGRLIERRLRELALPLVRVHLNAEKQRLGSRVIRTVTLKHVAAGQTHRLEGRMDSVSVSAEVTLSSDWIVHVWARGLAVVDGAFVLNVLDPTPVTEAGTVPVRAVRWHPVRPGERAFTPVLVDAVAVPSEDGWRLTGEVPAR